MDKKMDLEHKEIVKEPITKFIPIVSEMEFWEYQTWQCWGHGAKPEWFMTNNKKADEIMFQYKKVEHYYNNSNK
tara:strand:- start:194 stop:415 length:222 start_codon:yes stop_codon:yes gene_type:complete